MYYTTEKQTLTIEFLLAPSNRYVGWVIYNNAYYWGSANTLERLEHNVQQSLWKTHGKGLNIRLRLASKPTERGFVPLDKMSNHFKGRAYFSHKITDRIKEDQLPVFKRTVKKTVKPVEKPQPIYHMPKEEEFICKEKDGYMCIYKLAEVAKYKILKGE